MIAKCPYCNSIWVCWNWIHIFKDKHNEMNPHMLVNGDVWSHECWKCSSVFETYGDRIINGVPYWFLVWFSPNYQIDCCTGKVYRKMNIFDYFPFTLPFKIYTQIYWWNRRRKEKKNEFNRNRL